MLEKQKAENHRIDAMCQLMADCLMDLRCYHFFQACAEVIADVQPLMDGIQDDFDLWASACMDVVIRCQDLESDQALLPLTLDEVTTYFQLAKKDVRVISDRMYTFIGAAKSAAYQVVQFDHLIEDLENIPLKTEWLVDYATYRYDRPLQESHGPYLEKILIHNLVNILDSEAEIQRCEVTDDRLHIRVDGYLFDRILIDYILEDLGFIWLEGGEEEREENRFTPSAHYRTFMEQYEVMDFDGLEASSMEDLNQRIKDRFTGKTIDQLRAENPISADAHALIEALDAFHLSKEKSQAKVRSILKQFPNCVEAHICLAGWEEKPARRIEHLNDAIKAAENVLDIEKIDDDGLWWANHRTRPYLRALYLLGIEYAHDKQFAAAEDILLELLDMNPSDNLGVRYFLLEYGMVHKKWPIVRNLFKEFPDEDGIVFHYAKFMYLYSTLGNKSKTRRALLNAFDRNPFPFKILVGTVPEPEEPDRYRVGSPEEAVMVLPLLTKFMEDNQKFKQWCLRTLLDNKRVLEEDQEDSFWPDQGREN